MKKTNQYLILFLFFLSIFKLWLLFKANLPLQEEQVDLALVSDSLTKNSVNNIRFLLSFMKQHVTLFVFPVVYLSFFDLFLSSVLSIRIAGMLLHIFFTALIILLLKHKIKNELFLCFAGVFILFHPWLTTLSTFHLGETLSVTGLICIFYLIKTSSIYKFRQRVLFTVLMLITALSSWSGLFFIVSMLIILPYVVKNKVGSIKSPNLIKIVLPAYLILTIFLFMNKTIVIDKLNYATIIANLNIERLTQEVNETLTTIYLSTNQQWMLPSILQKIFVNKGTVAVSIIFKHIIEFFDFELFASTLGSKDITRYSGVPPKGQIPFGTVSEIILLVIGLFSLKRHFRLFFVIFLPPFVGYFVFEHKFFVWSAATIVCLVILIEILALNRIFKKTIVQTHNVYKNAVIAGIVLMSLEFAIFHHNIFFRYKDYGLSNYLFFQEAVDNINEYDNSQLFVTTRPGPIYKYYSVYTEVNKHKYWKAVTEREFEQNNTELTKLDNVNFLDIDHQVVQNNHGIFIAFTGELLPENESNEDYIKNNYEVLDSFTIPDEIVYGMSNKLWIIKN